MSSNLFSRNVNALLPSGNSLIAGTKSDVCLFDGIAWKSLRNGLPDPGTPWETFALVQSGSDIFAGTSVGVFRTTDNGSNWISMNNGLTTVWVRAMILRGSELMAGTNGGGVFRSTDKGASWTPAGTGIGTEYVYSLFSSGGSLYAGTGHGPFLSTDNGAQWTASNTGLISRVYAFAQSGSNLFAATGVGLWFSSDAGAKWTKVSIDAACREFYSLYIQGTMLYAGTDMGVWKRPVSELTGVKSASVLHMPDAPLLHPNYPNPFNPGTVIPFTVTADGHVSIKIFDLAGKETATLVSERLGPGEHEAKWNAFSLPGGMYLCRLEAGGLVFTRKLVLMK
jgi:photosystem II stability/assembly factor-like uncharacterized protein